PDEVVIKDGKANFLSAGKELETFRNLKIELDPKKKPRAMDLLRGPNEGLPCIYEVTATDLKIAMPLVPKKRKPGEGLPRPESFDSKDKPVMVFIAKRDMK
ncbi:MAG TPA: hypothetical protein VLM40_12625, partial [Gemmata sp.]|nr:hypothetical protein [Gemmata sp.]